jgi:hypothetical protein
VWLAFDNMHDRGVPGTTDWKRFEINLPVAAGAININFGALFSGSGTAWFDGLLVELDGVPQRGSINLISISSHPLPGFSSLEVQGMKCS